MACACRGVVSVSHRINLNSMTAYRPLLEWGAIGLLVGLIAGGGGVYWWTYPPVKTITRTVPGPSRVVVRKVIVYRHHVVARRVVACGRRRLTVTATMRPARTPVTSRKDFGAKRIHLSIASYRPWFSFKQRPGLLAGYAVTMPAGGVPTAGLSFGLRDRFVRVGPVRGVVSAFSVGPMAVVLVDARVNL